MKNLIILIVALLTTLPAYAQTTLGTSSSATNPQRSSDATTGLFSSTTDAVSVSSGGTEVMRVNGTGVGIGTSSPNAVLEVYSNNPSAGYGHEILESDTSAQYPPLFEFIDYRTGSSGHTYQLSSGSLGSAFTIKDLTANRFDVTIEGSGDVGIGTDAPANMLDVSGAVAIGSYAGTTAPSNGLIISGNVGIGTTAPANSLDVASGGGIHVTSGVPSSTLSALYNSSGTLAWNGGLVIGSGGHLQCSGSNCGNSTGSGAIQYCPYKGNTKTTASQGNYTIPSACLTATLTSMYVGGVASSSVSASTLYYIYIWNVSGTWVLDAETTGHAMDSATGVEIESGDNTKTLVGMIHTDSSKHVMTGGKTNVQGDTNTVATWDNRIPTKTYCGFTTSRQINSATLVEINSENRCLFMNWADAAQLSSQLVTHAGGATLVETEITLDGASNSISTLEVFSNDSLGGGYGFNVLAVAPAVFVPAEGYHYTETLGMSGTQYATYPYGPSNVFTIQ